MSNDSVSLTNRFERFSGPDGREYILPDWVKITKTDATNGLQLNRHWDDLGLLPIKNEKDQLESEGFSLFIRAKNEEELRQIILQLNENDVTTPRAPMQWPDTDIYSLYAYIYHEDLEKVSQLPGVLLIRPIEADKLKTFQALARMPQEPTA